MGQYIPMAQGYGLWEPCRSRTMQNDGDLIVFGLSIKLAHEWQLSGRADPFILSTSGKNNLLQPQFLDHGCNGLRDLLSITSDNDVAAGLLQKVDDRHWRYPEGK